MRWKSNKVVRFLVLCLEKERVVNLDLQLNHPSREKKSPAGNSALSNDQIDDLTSWIFSTKQAAEIESKIREDLIQNPGISEFPERQLFVKNVLSEPQKTNFQLLIVGFCRRFSMFMTWMFQAARQKEQESCIFSCLDETTWQCYSRKTIPGTLNRRTILGWTTVRGRIGSRGSYGLLVKENALASEGKSYRPAITAENQYACYHLSLRNKRQKSHFLICSVKT